MLGLNNVMLRVFSYNERAIRAYQRAGFQEIGRRREAQRVGDRAYDVIFMDCLARDFDQLEPTRLRPPETELVADMDDEPEADPDADIDLGA
jgi:hypothetical protein